MDIFLAASGSGEAQRPGRKPRPGADRLAISMHLSKSARSWLTATAGAVIIAAGVCLLKRESLSGSLASLMQVFSDGCFIAGALYFCVYLLMRISRAGGFDMSGYLGHAMARLFSRRKEEDKPGKDYYTYRTEKEEARQARQPSPVQRMLLWIGLSFLLLSVLLVGGYFLAA